MKEKYEVRCNMCGWEGYENDLVLCEDEGGFFNGCPNCKKDDYLMDIEKDCN